MGECRSRGLLTVFDRLSNRRILGEMGPVPEVQLPPHTVRSQHICQMVERVSISLCATSALGVSFSNIYDSVLAH